MLQRAGTVIETNEVPAVSETDLNKSTTKKMFNYAIGF